MMVFRYYSFSQWPHAGQIWGCLRGVWMVSRVSGSVWMVSENVIQMSGVCRCLVNWNQLNKYHDNQILLFLPVAACRPNMGVSEGCLDGVWGCLAVSEHVWLMSGFDRYQINWKQLNKYHGIQILLFLPVASCRPNMGMSEGCLDGVWGCLAVSGWCLSVSGRCLGCMDVI